MAKKYVVELTDEERNQLLALLKKGKVAARKLSRAQILLQADEGASDALIATTLYTGVATVERTRKRLVEERLEAALTERRRLGGQPKLCGKNEAFLVATACSVPLAVRASRSITHICQVSSVKSGDKLRDCLLTTQSLVLLSGPYQSASSENQIAGGAKSAIPTFDALWLAAVAHRPKGRKGE